MLGSRFLVNPRLLGVREQYARARHFLTLARRSKNPIARYRNLVAALYPARAIVELMLYERWSQLNSEAEDFEASKQKAREDIRGRFPYHNLIHRARIHDFHRFGLLPPDDTVTITMILGPIELVARSGTAAIVLKDGIRV